MFLFEILLSRSISNRNIKNVLKSITFEKAWIHFPYLFIEREDSVIADISLTFDEPVGESEVESLLLDAINNGSLGNLKVDTFSVGPTISGVYKISTRVLSSAPNESWVCDLRICTTDTLPLWC